MSRVDSFTASRVTRFGASPRLRAGVGIALLLLAAAYVVWPLRQMIRGWNDFAFAYAAGLSWQHGASPYDVPRWQAEWAAIRPSFVSEPPSQPFMYPPHFALLAVPVALLSWPVATRAWDVVNVLSFAGLCVASVSLLPSETEDGGTHAVPWFFLALATLSGPVRWALWESQMVVLPALGILGAFWAWHHRRPHLLAAFAFIAALKPHIAFLPLAYLFLNGGARGLLLGAGAAFTVALAALLPSGLASFPREVGDSYARHMRIEFNAPDQFTSLSALFATHDPRRHWFLLCPLLGLGGVVWLTLVRRRGPLGARDPLFQPLWQLSLVAALGAAFVPLHGYDLVTYVPLVVLSSVIRPGVLAALVVVAVQLAGRAPALSARLHVHPLTPYLTLSVLAVSALAFQRARYSSALQPKRDAR